MTGCEQDVDALDYASEELQNDPEIIESLDDWYNTQVESKYDWEDGFATSKEY